VSADETLMMWKAYIPSKRARFRIKTFELCEAKSCYIWNSVIYIGQDTLLNKSLKMSHMDQK
jgi:hypothetical protein